MTFLKRISITRFFSGLLVLALAVSSPSCRKRLLFERNYFAFGIEYGYCDGDCADFFLIADGKLYKDDVSKAKSKLRFDNESVEDWKYRLTMELKDKFPDFLANKPNETYGLPDEYDQGRIRIERKVKGKLQVWKIDPITNNIPVEIRDYVTLLQSTLYRIK